MPRLRFLTPDNLPSATKVCRRLILPDDEQYTALLRGALLELCSEFNFEQVDGISTADAESAFREIYDTWEPCRVIGEIIPYAGNSSPDSRWLVCDGSSLLRADYAELFAVIGTTYGSVDGSHFSLPDCRGRTNVGSGAGTGLTNRALGSTFGTEQHTLVTGEMPVHTHVDLGHSHAYFAAQNAVLGLAGAIPVATAFPLSVGLGSANIQNAGGGGSHNNMQPSVAINYLIVAKP